MIEKLFKDLAKEPQDFSLLPENSVEETENPTTSEMIFVRLHEFRLKKFLKKKHVKCPVQNIKSSILYILSGKHW